MHRTLAVLMIGLSLVGAAVAQAGEPLKELRVSAIPDENPNELMRIYAPFAEYLSRELGMKVIFTNVVDYAATVEGLASKKLEMVWYGASPSSRPASGPAMRCPWSAAKRTSASTASSSRARTRESPSWPT